MKVSLEKREKISEQILAFLYSISPQLVFTSHIANELARDEEFTKNLLLELKKKGLILEVKKSSTGSIYLRRSRWRLSDTAYKAYKENQE
ncbi:MAG: hypothetical protein AABX26_00460 [Nanoarchaeota archaeon]